MNIQDLLVVKIGSNFYGFDANKIQHILRVPSITPVPLVSSKILGVSVILGKIISILDSATILNEGLTDIKNENTRILTISDEAALMVDEVTEMITLNNENLEESNGDEELILGFYKTDDKIIQILDSKKILENIELLSYSAKNIESLNNNKEKNLITSETERLLFFQVQNEDFAIDIEFLKEIIYIPEITPTTNSDILGLITLRQDVISVLDLNTQLGFETDIKSKTRAIIIWYENKSVALLVDDVKMVEDVDKNLIEKMPENFKDSNVEAVYKGDKIVSILSTSFIANLIRKYHIKEENDDIKKDEIKELNMKELAVFKIDNEEYAFDIKNVQEIIKYNQTTPIPEAPMYVEGLFNLRGSVIPIISLQERLGFDKKLDDKTKIIVCNLKDEKVGFIVDDVSDIMFIDDKNISKTSNKEAVFDEVITLDDGKRVILNINLDTLIDDETIEDIKMVVEEK